MDWKDLAPIVGAIAPTAGSILGGLIPFPGGSIIGEKFGQFIADALGVARDPAAVRAKLDADSGQTIAAINAATERARVEIQGFVDMERAVQATIQESIRQTNETMRVEILPENRHWFFTGWRPAAGWTLIWFMVGLGLIILWATVLAVAGNPAPLNTISAAWPIYLSYIASLAAVVGVYVVARSQDKATIAAAAPPVVIKKK